MPMAGTGRAVGAYVVAACLMRAADAGAIVAVVLEAQRLHLGGATGLVAACLTLPHLAGPLAAHLLDRTAAKRALIAAASCLYGTAVLASALLLAVSVPAAAVALLIAGSAGPLLTGGLSSQLAPLVPPGERAQRRAQSIDAFTYGIATTGGPALIGVCATLRSPAIALAAAAALAVLGALALAALPRRASAGRPADAALGIRGAVAVLFVSGPLRRATIGTAITALPLGAVPLLAVAVAGSLSVPTTVSATLAAVYGLGNLAASAGLIVLPLRGRPDRLLQLGLGVVTIALAATSLARALPVGLALFFLLGAATGILFAASLAVRAAHAPDNAAARVFVTMAGIKVAFSSLGAAAAGALLPLGGPALLGLGAVLSAAVLAYAIVDARADAHVHGRIRAEGPGAAR
jgi:hypothetical protein